MSVLMLRTPVVFTWGRGTFEGGGLFLLLLGQELQIGCGAGRCCVFIILTRKESPDALKSCQGGRAG